MRHRSTVGASLDAAIAELARRQHGVVARWQLAKLGSSRGRIEARLRRGSLHLVHRGVYAVGHRSLDAQGPVDGCGAGMRARRGPEPSVGCGQLGGLLPRSSGPIEVTRPRQLPDASEHRECTMRQLPADERTVVDGIPVTSVPRTMLRSGGAWKSASARASPATRPRFGTDRQPLGPRPAGALSRTRRSAAAARDSGDRS